MDISLNDTTGRYAKSRRLPYQFGINSWDSWCKKNNCEAFILRDLVCPVEEMKICWQRYCLFDLLESSEISYSQVAIVDSDTIIHPDAPNFFNLTDGDFTAVHNEGNYDWIIRSMEHYKEGLFSNTSFPWYEYFNCGFMVVNETHRSFFAEIQKFYRENVDKIQQLETFSVGTDQTPLNYLVRRELLKLKLLPYEYNMVDLARKNLLRDTLPFTDLGYIYHFNSIPNNNNNAATYYWMEKTYKYLYGTK